MGNMDSGYQTQGCYKKCTEQLKVEEGSDRMF
jgi:hypothetical protein